MDKNNINKEKLEEYLSKLENFENIINGDGNTDNELFMDIENTLKSLSDDLTETLSKKTYKTSEIIEENITIKIKKLSTDAIIPNYSTDSDVGVDLTCISESIDEFGNRVYGTGLSIEIPKGYGGFIFPRSSVSKYQLDLANAVGVIDPGYRGEIICKFKTTSHFTKENLIITDHYNIGDRIAQLVIIKRPKINFIVSDELSETERGIGGFGSTGT